MKKQRLVIIAILVTLFSGALNISSVYKNAEANHDSEPHQPEDYVNAMEALESVVGEIILIDLEWRFPYLKFVDTGRILHAVSKADGSPYFSINSEYRIDRLGRMRSQLLFAPEIYVVPSHLKGTLNSYALPLGFKIYNPDNGFIEERWDGGNWLRPNQRSQRDFRRSYNRLPGANK